MYLIISIHTLHKNLLTGGVTFGNKTSKLPILTNVECCSCLFYKCSPLSIVIKCTIIIPTSKINEETVVKSLGFEEVFYLF
jgi:hypothetical protein